VVSRCDTYADVVKIVVREIGGVPLFFAESVAFVAAGTRIEKLPAMFGGIVDGVLVADDEMVNGESNENCVRKTLSHAID
jgi:hypothetical protein